MAKNDKVNAPETPDNQPQADNAPAADAPVAQAAPKLAVDKQAEKHEASLNSDAVLQPGATPAVSDDFIGSLHAAVNQAEANGDAKKAAHLNGLLVRLGDFKNHLHHLAKEADDEIQTIIDKALSIFK